MHEECTLKRVTLLVTKSAVTFNLISLMSLLNNELHKKKSIAN